MLIDELLKWVNGNGVVVGLLTFLLGTLFGHWLAIHRDDRARRIAAFSELRRRLTACVGQVYISAAEADAVMTTSLRWRRKGLQRAIEQCNSAADAYYATNDDWGQPFPSSESEAAMSAARLNLINHLRRP